MFNAAKARGPVAFKMDTDEDDGSEKSNGSRPFSQTVNEYSEAATIHGIFYIFENGRLVLERVFWVIVVIAAIAFATIMSYNAYAGWKANQVLTSVATTGYPIEKIPFPSITICPQGSAGKIIDAALFRQFNDYLLGKNKTISELSSVELHEEGLKFLADMYPGARKSPQQLVQMMGSPGIKPDKSLVADALLNPESTNNCGDTNKTVVSYNYTTSATCPKGFFFANTDLSIIRPCWHFTESAQLMDKPTASVYCKNLTQNWSLFTIHNRTDFEILWNILSTGKI